MKVFAKLFFTSLLLTFFASSLQEEKRKPNRPSKNERETCEDCFGENRCLGRNENLNDGCITCLVEECETEFSEPLSSSFGIECIAEAVEGNCSDVCQSIELSEDTVENCEDCVENCLSKRFPRDTCPERVRTRGTYACQSCIASDSCFNETEVPNLFSKFCLGYVTLSCAEDPTNECIMQALTSSCSQCTVSVVNLNRLGTCTTCLDNCREEGQCINDCSKKNTFPNEVPCGYCSLFCNLEGRTRPGRNPERHHQPQPATTCDLDDSCPACESCNLCVDRCREDNPGTFNHTNLCTCVQEYNGERIERQLASLGLRSIFQLGWFRY